MTALLRIVLRLLYRVRVFGEVKAAGDERLLIVANHTSLIDALLLALFIPVEPLVVVSREERSNWIVRAVIASVRHLALELDEPASLKKLAKLISSEAVVALFPEGRISRTGSMMKILEVPALAAVHTNAKIVPVYLEGPERSRAGHAASPVRKRWAPRIRIHIHSPLRLCPPSGATSRVKRQAATSELRRTLQGAAAAAYPRQTLFETLLETVATEGRRTRIVEDMHGGPETYGRLVKKSLALGKLARRFSGERETVGVLLPNCNATVYVLFGLTAMGRIPAMLNYGGGAPHLEDSCITANARKIITSRRFIEAAKLEEAVKSLTRVQVLYLEDLREQWRFTDSLWVLYAGAVPRRVIAKLNPFSPAVVLFTSGSEDRPKGVALSHSAILANIWQMGAVIDFSRADKFLNALPIYHAYGFTCCTIMPILSGTRLYFYPNPLHYHLIPRIAYRHDCTCLFGTSTFLQQYGMQAQPYDFSSVRYVVSGAERLHPEVQRLWSEKFGLRILEGYGATECAPALSLNTPLAYRSETVGLFLPGIEHRIEPVEGIRNGGVLHVRGANLMLGYLRYQRPGFINPLKSVFGEGWHCTGDVVEVDREGFVRIKARIRRFAKVAGEMVSLDAAEQLAALASNQHRHAAILETNVIRGESITLFTSDPGLNRIDLSRVAKGGGFSTRAIPRRIIHLAEIPLLATGKTDYGKLAVLAPQSVASDEPRVLPNLVAISRVLS
jgi:acyl-[acyl-carrier-protein]-phospholipid O-acyltransferase/long-chain-fatty-acid--[acyl-carrier-protein] ligase